MVDTDMHTYLHSLTLQRSAAVQHTLVFGLAGDHMVPLPLEEAHYALDGQVIGLRSAGCKDNLLGGRA